MEAADGNTTIMDVDAAASADSVAAEESADRSNLAGREEIVNNLNNADNAIETTKDGDITVGVVMRKLTYPPSITVADSVDSENADTVHSADSADPTDNRSIEIDDSVDSVDQSAKGDSNDCESDNDSTSESSCLEVMTPDGQEYYLRLGDTPRRRSALRLSRIIARQQLLRRVAQGRNGESYDRVLICLSFIVRISVWLDLFLRGKDIWVVSQYVWPDHI